MGAAVGVAMGAMVGEALGLASGAAIGINVGNVLLCFCFIFTSTRLSLA